MQDVYVHLPVRVWRWLLGGFGLLAIALFVVWAFFLRGERAYLIDADTQGMTIVFDRSAASSWRLTEATICRRLGAGETAPGGAPNRFCDAGLFAETSVPSLEIEWPAGTRIEIERHRSDGALTVRITEVPKKPPEVAGQVLPKGTLIFISANGWAGAGALTFSGSVDIGAIPGPGSRDLLLSGRYEIREMLAGRSTPLTVKQDVLSPGDSVSLVRADGQGGAPVSGFLLRRQSGDTRTGFKVIAFSAFDDVGLRIARLNAQSTIVKASWTDRALRDPWLLGLAALLSFVSTVLGLISRFWPKDDG